MLRYEPLIRTVERTVEKTCRETRMDMGLHPMPGVECEDEPCLGKCPFKDVKP
jgi:hypothetical protein